jgi:hypothetical protein
MNTLDLTKAITALGASATLAVSNRMMASVDNIPDWLREFGLPVVVAGLAIWAGVKLFKIYQNSIDARIADRDAEILRWQAESKNAQESREKLIEATCEQTATLKQLPDAVAAAVVKSLASQLENLHK